MEVGDQVDIIIGRESKIGFSVLIDHEFEGLVYKNEAYIKLHEGDKMKAYVKKIREDGKIDISLQPIGFLNTITQNEQFVMDALKKANEGFLPLHDKSSPEDIKYALNMSKKAFKAAIGGLYKKKLLDIRSNGLYLK